MKTAILAVTIFALAANAESQVYDPDSSDFNITTFCSQRPTGLYCHPHSSYQKIECPTEKIFTCPNAPAEFCQERGVLRTFGYKGGIARCVPFISAQSLNAFCEKKKPGVYCYNDPDKNVRVQCPNGIIYKCADNPTADSKKCLQKSSTYATCSDDSGGSGGNCNITIPTMTVTKTVTVDVTTIVTAPCQVPLTSTIVNPVSVTPDPVPTSTTNQLTSTAVDVVTTTQIEFLTSSTVQTSQTILVGTSSPAVSVYSTSTVIIQTTDAPRSTVTVTGSAATVTNNDFTRSIVIPTEESVSSNTAAVSTTATTTPCNSSAVTVTKTAETSQAVVKTSTSSEVTATNNDFTRSIVIPTIEPATSTKEDLPTLTSQGDGGPTVVPPDVVNCPQDGSPQQAINNPDGANFKYVFTSTRLNEQDAFNACKSLGGQLAVIATPEEHWWLGQQLCEPSWYQSWEGNNYLAACVALFPGGATAVPPGSCDQKLVGLCKVPNSM